MRDTLDTNTVSALFQLIYLAMEYEKTPGTYGTDTNISTAEIYQLKCIQEMDKANITSLGDALGISKSAVSQSVKKLKTKGLVKTSIDGENHSRYILSLTPKGRIAHNEHLRQNAEIRARIHQSLEGCSEKGSEEILSFLKSSKKILADYLP